MAFLKPIIARPPTDTVLHPSWILYCFGLYLPSWLLTYQKSKAFPSFLVSGGLMLDQVDPGAWSPENILTVQVVKETIAGSREPRWRWRLSEIKITQHINVAVNLLPVQICSCPNPHNYILAGLNLTSKDFLASPGNPSVSSLHAFMCFRHRPRLHGFRCKPLACPISGYVHSLRRMAKEYSRKEWNLLKYLCGRREIFSQNTHLEIPKFFCSDTESLSFCAGG